MKKIIVPLITAFMVSIPMGLSADNSHWSYSDKTAPTYSASLSDHNSLCNSGKNQSPIDIDTKRAVNAGKRGLKFNYGRLDPKHIFNTGKQLQLNVAQGANIKVDGIEFELKHLSFHTPSENTYNKQHFPMEIQFIHQSKDHQLAIVSLMVTWGKSSRTLVKLQQQLPMNTGESKQLTTNALRNLERKQKVANYYRYNGSLTTPPCTEGVRWFIMNQPLKISKQHYQSFRQAMKHNNNRPIQELNARLILK